MSELGGAVWVAITLAALWIVIAIAVSIAAARRFRRASAVMSSAQSMASLLDVAPARPLLVHPDSRIEVDPRLLRELGLDQAPARLAELAGENVGIEQDDLDALVGDIQAAALAGGKIERKVRSAGSRRVFDVRGGPAPSPEPPGTLLLWLFDTSASEEERSNLSSRLRQTEGALDSLTHLIESAPFPMWFRGPDLKLGLVNSAFVEAVEASDAEDVIARGIELIDEPGDNGALAAARHAVEAGKIQSRNQAAIIRGERRMLRIVNVPLQTGAVAGFAIDIQDLEDARYELARHIQSQRELSDRMTAGAAQFDADRSLNFYNQPFAVMAQLDPEWLSERPEFDRVLERMRENHRLPETRDFPAWKDERRAWFSSADEVVEEEWMLANGDHLRVVAQALPEARRAGALSGPSFALEVAKGLPTAVVFAADDRHFAHATAAALNSPRLRIYSSDDLPGVELGGALKNVVAIAAGISDGLSLGRNARAALVTRGLAEISRLGAAMGGRPETFNGLTGLGDLVLTCTGDLSRNRDVGVRLARGQKLDAILAELGHVAEGVHSARAAREHARGRGVEMPITEAICAVLFEGRSATEAVQQLLMRDPRRE